MHGKKARTKSFGVTSSKIELPPPIRSFNLSKEVDLMFGLAEVVLDVVIEGRNTELNKLLLECTGLFKEAIHTSLYIHIS